MFLKTKLVLSRPFFSFEKEVNMELFEAGVKMSLEEAVGIAELTDINGCDGEAASISFGQWLRIFYAAQFGSALERKSLAKMIRIARRNKTKKDEKRRIVKWQKIFEIVPAGSREEELAAREVITELKRLKEELKSEKSLEA